MQRHSRRFRKTRPPLSSTAPEHRYGYVSCDRSRMHSIDAQQSEQNHEDLQGAPALAKLHELIKKAPTCFFCTKIRNGHPFATRPMSVQRVDADGTLWFLSPNDSQKNDDVINDAAVQLLFQGSAHSDFMTLYGRATVSADRKKIEELWEPILKTWFTEGVSDPRISVIRVVPEGGYYWDTKHGRATALAKMIAGAITGKTMDDSIEGRLGV
jgi:general stress protein 26